MTSPSAPVCYTATNTNCGYGSGSNAFNTPAQCMAYAEALGANVAALQYCGQCWYATISYSAAVSAGCQSATGANSNCPGLQLGTIGCSNAQGCASTPDAVSGSAFNTAGNCAGSSSPYPAQSCISYTLQGVWYGFCPAGTSGPGGHAPCTACSAGTTSTSVGSSSCTRRASCACAPSNLTAEPYRADRCGEQLPVDDRHVLHDGELMRHSLLHQPASKRGVHVRLFHFGHGLPVGL